MQFSKIVKCINENITIANCNFKLKISIKWSTINKEVSRSHWPRSSSQLMSSTWSPGVIFFRKCRVIFIRRQTKIFSVRYLFFFSLSKAYFSKLVFYLTFFIKLQMLQYSFHFCFAIISIAFLKDTLNEIHKKGNEEEVKEKAALNRIIRICFIRRKGVGVEWVENPKKTNFFSRFFDVLTFQKQNDSQSLISNFALSIHYVTKFTKTICYFYLASLSFLQKLSAIRNKDVLRLF